MADDGWDHELGKIKAKTVKRKLLDRPQVEFSAHALIQMRRRKVTEQQVYLVVEEPTETGLKVSGPRGRKRVRRDKGSSSYLEVVYALRPTKVIIVTAMVVPRSKGKRSR